MEKPINVDEFIAKAATKAQPILVELRKLIKGSFPNIEEKIGYGVPLYKYKDASLGMSVAKKHVTLGVTRTAISDAVRKNLEAKGYKLGLQTVQIQFEQEIPKHEIQNIFNEIIQSVK